MTPRSCQVCRSWLLAFALIVWGAAAQAADYLPLPAGRFESVLPQGGTPNSSGPVEIRALQMRRLPVTRGEFQAFVLTQPQWQRGVAPGLFVDARYLLDWDTPQQPPGTATDADALLRPVTQLSWFAAKAFCEAEGGRLPTWLEWEYAAAADEGRRDARADPAWRRRILAWYERPASQQPTRVGRGQPNVYGLHDLHGLVWEWVEDFNALFIAGDSRTQGDPDLLKFCGTGALSVIDRDSYAVLMRIALLSSLAGSDTTSSLGFRCVKASEGDQAP